MVLVVYETCIHYEFPSFLSTQTTQPLVDDLPITTKAQTILPIPQETGQLIPSTLNQSLPIVSTIGLVTYTIEEPLDFGEDGVVVLWDYCFSKKNKEILRRGSKRTREGQVLPRSYPHQVIWKQASDDPQMESTEVNVSMGEFIGANCNSVFVLNQALEEAKTNNVILQTKKETL